MEKDIVKGDSVVNDINHPQHYTYGAIEVIDAIEAWGLDFHLGNVVKYVARSEHKGNQLKDLKKAQWYLNRKISKLEQGK
jgi:hypothetical protein